MQEESFSNGLERLKTWFQKTNLSEDHYFIIYNQIKFIPDVAWDEIIDKCIEENKPQPSNFPTISDLKKAWYAWRRDNPDKSAKSREPQPCEECYGKGVIWYHRDNPQYIDSKIEHFVICPRCTNWRLSFSSTDGLPVRSREQLEIQGLEVWPYSDKTKEVIKGLDQFKMKGVPF
jgi:hypothetical protein